MSDTAMDRLWGTLMMLAAISSLFALTDSTLVSKMDMWERLIRSAMVVVFTINASQHLSRKS
jgi:hypothetical protein